MPVELVAKGTKVFDMVIGEPAPVRDVLKEFRELIDPKKWQEICHFALEKQDTNALLLVRLLDPDVLDTLDPDSARRKLIDSLGTSLKLEMDGFVNADLKLQEFCDQYTRLVMCFPKEFRAPNVINRNFRGRSLFGSIESALNKNMSSENWMVYLDLLAARQAIFFYDYDFYPMSGEDSPRVNIAEELSRAPVARVNSMINWKIVYPEYNVPIDAMQLRQYSLESWEQAISYLKKPGDQNIDRACDYLLDNIMLSAKTITLGKEGLKLEFQQGIEATPENPKLPHERSF